MRARASGAGGRWRQTHSSAISLESIGDGRRKTQAAPANLITADDGGVFRHYPLRPRTVLEYRRPPKAKTKTKKNRSMLRFSVLQGKRNKTTVHFRIRLPAVRPTFELKSYSSRAFEFLPLLHPFFSLSLSGSTLQHQQQHPLTPKQQQQKRNQSKWH